MPQTPSLLARLACLIGAAIAFSFVPAHGVPTPRPKPAIVYQRVVETAPAVAPAVAPLQPASEAAPPRDLSALLWEIYRLLWLITAIALGVAALAIWQALATRDAQRRQSRAYIAVRPGLAPRLDTDWTDASVVIKNHGTTPAFALDHATTLMMLDYPELALDNVMGAADKMFGHKAIVLAPGAELSVQLRTVLSDDEKLETADGTHKRLCTLGEVRYADAFGKKHATRFCFMYGGAALIASGEMQVADKGNLAT